MTRKLLIVLLFACYSSFLPWLGHAKTNDQTSNSSYESVNFDAFEIMSKEVKDLEFSTQTIGDRKELVIQFLDSSHELQVYFKSHVQKRNCFFGKGFFILPPEPIKSACLVNRQTDTFLKLDITAFHETDKCLNYVACSDVARIDIFTDLQGRIFQVNIAYELEKGGMEEFRKCQKIYRALKRDKINSSS